MKLSTINARTFKGKCLRIGYPKFPDHIPIQVLEVVQSLSFHNNTFDNSVVGVQAISVLTELRLFRYENSTVSHGGTSP